MIKFYINLLKQKVYYLYFISLWKKRNKNNFTYPKGVFNLSHVKVGKCTYGELNVVDQADKDYFLDIGNYCSIAPNVTFLLAGEHNTKTISTYPFITLKFQLGKEAGSKGNIIVEDDVWIGINSVICSGVKISKGSIIAANSVVTKDVPPYSICAGVPAKVIKYRFSEKLRERMINIDLQSLFDKFTRDDIQRIYSENEDDMLYLLEKYNN